MKIKMHEMFFFSCLLMLPVEDAGPWMLPVLPNAYLASNVHINWSNIMMNYTYLITTRH